MKKNINFNIKDGDAFYAHEMSINFNPMQFIFDFKCITPRIDIRSKDSNVISITHNVILIDPYQAKQLHKVLGDAIKKYEKEFSKIEKPKQLAVAEKKQGKVDSKKDHVPYFG